MIVECASSMFHYLRRPFPEVVMRVLSRGWIEIFETSIFEKSCSAMTLYYLPLELFTDHLKIIILVSGPFKATATYLSSGKNDIEVTNLC